jgi:aminoglycoside phosphotransferase (APT) family kinase protein
VAVDVAVKLHRDAKAAAREADVLRRLGAAAGAGRALRVPRLLAHEEEALVMTWLPGVPCADAWPALPVGGAARADVAFEAGVLLAEVQGALAAAPLAEATFWRGAADDAFERFVWRDYLHALVAKWSERVVVGEEDRRLGVPEAIAAVGAAVAGLTEPARVTLLHCDFALRNVLCDPTSRQVVGLIDFATALVGDPIYDLAKMTWADFGRDEPRLRAALCRGWAEGAGAGPGADADAVAGADAAIDDARLRLYEAIQGLAAVAWVDRRGPAGAHAAFRSAGRNALLSLAG